MKETMNAAAKTRRCSVCSETGHNARTCGKAAPKPAKVKPTPYVEPPCRPLAEVGDMVVFFEYEGVSHYGVVTEVIDTLPGQIDSCRRVEWFDKEATKHLRYSILNTCNYWSTWRTVR